MQAEQRSNSSLPHLMVLATVVPPLRLRAQRITLDPLDEDVAEEASGP